MFFIKKETLAQVFSCEFCEISKNTFSNRTPLVATSGQSFPNKGIRKLPKQLQNFLNIFYNCLSPFLTSYRLTPQIYFANLF